MGSLRLAISLSMAVLLAACGDAASHPSDAPGQGDAAGPGADGSSQDPDVHRIADENTRPGTTAWRLNRPAEAREIEGYATRISSGGEPVR